MVLIIMNISDLFSAIARMFKRTSVINKQKDVVHIALPMGKLGVPPQKPWREIRPTKKNPGDRSLY
jgi:hypothetical protein